MLVVTSQASIQRWMREKSVISICLDAVPLPNVTTVNSLTNVFLYFFFYPQKRTLAQC